MLLFRNPIFLINNNPNNSLHNHLLQNPYFLHLFLLYHNLHHRHQYIHNNKYNNQFNSNNNKLILNYINSQFNNNNNNNNQFNKINNLLYNNKNNNFNNLHLLFNNLPYFNLHPHNFPSITTHLHLLLLHIHLQFHLNPQIHASWAKIWRLGKQSLFSRIYRMCLMLLFSQRRRYRRYRIRFSKRKNSSSWHRVSKIAIQRLNLICKIIIIIKIVLINRKKIILLWQIIKFKI